MVFHRSTYLSGLESQVIHLPPKGLGFLEALGVHRPLAGLETRGGPSFQLVQEAPYLLVALSNLGCLRGTTVPTVRMTREDNSGFTRSGKALMVA